jgi:PEP-CTERM motif-containing protein
MNKFQPKKKGLAAACAVALGLTGMASQSQADVLGSTVLQVLNAELLACTTVGQGCGATRSLVVDISSTTGQIIGGDFLVIDGSNSSNVDADLIPGGSTALGTTRTLSNNGGQIDLGGGGSVEEGTFSDLFVGTLPAAGGGGAWANNTWDSITNTENPNAGDPVQAPAPQFALADADLAGSIIDIKIDGVDSSTGGADSRTRADSGLTENVIGDANSNVGAVFSYTFQVAENGPIEVVFEADFLLNSEAYVFTGAAPGTDAKVRNSWSISIVDATGNTVLGLAPDFDGNNLTPGGQCNIGATLLTQGTRSECNYSSTNQRSNYATLSGGQVYTLTIAHSTEIDVINTDAGKVPAPATIALFGAGLLGMSGLRRRRKSS